MNVRSLLTISVVMLHIQPIHAQEQEQRTTSQAEASNPLQTITITGTHIALPSASDYAARPVDVVTATDIAQTGETTVEGFLTTRPEFVTALDNTSVSNDDNGLSARRLGVNQLDLRGVGAQYTLVLVNGQRFAGVDPTNVAAIPVSAIQRIEVLKDGASAIYGSDAVAGVVNIILKSGDVAPTLEVEQGVATQGGAYTGRYSLSGGTIGDKLSVFGTIEVLTRDGLDRNDRSITANPDFRRFDPNYPYTSALYVNPAQILLPNSNTFITLDQTRFGPGSISLNPADYTPFNQDLWITTGAFAQDWGMQSIVDSDRKISGALNSTYRVSDRVKLYGDLIYTYDRPEFQSAAFGVDFNGDPNGNIVFGPYPANGYWNPFHEALLNVFYNLPELGRTAQEVSFSTVRLNLGVQADVGRGVLDVGGAYFLEHGNMDALNYYSNTGMEAAITRPGPAAMNPFCNDCNTPEQIAGIRADWSSVTDNRLIIGNINYSAPLVSLPAGELYLAAGGEARQEALTQTPSANVTAHDVYFIAESPVDVRRTTLAAFAEINLPIFGDKFQYPALEKLSLSAAVRYEHIEEVGGTTNPNVSLRWEPIGDQLVVRGSYGTSFRAPPLEELTAAPTVLPEIYNNPQTGVPTIYRVYQGGNPNLKPETGTYYNVGLVITPSRLRGLALSVDNWWLYQKELIFQPDPLNVLNGLSPGTVDYNTSPASIIAPYQNANGRKVNGTDFNAMYTTGSTRYGVFNFSVYGTYLYNYLFNASVGTGYTQYAGNTDNNVIYGGLPKLRGGLQINWQGGAWQANYTIRYWGAYENSQEIVDQSVDRYVTNNIQLGWSASDHSSWWVPSVAIGVKDLFQAHVPFFYFPSYGIFNTGYDRTIVDPTGRFIYLRVNWRL